MPKGTVLFNKRQYLNDVLVRSTRYAKWRLMPFSRRRIKLLAFDREIVVIKILRACIGLISIKINFLRVMICQRIKYYRIAWFLHVALIALLAAPVYAAEPDDKDLTILHLKKIIAEQSMGQLLENEKVREYARIRAAYEKVLKEIAEKEQKSKEKDR